MKRHLNRWNPLSIWESSSHRTCPGQHTLTPSVQKERNLLALLYRRFSSNVNSERLLEMYKSLVRPHLEYAAPIWDPHLLKDIKSVENVQKYGLRMCLKKWDLGYQELLHLAQLPTLENRRIYLKLCTLFKITHGLFLSLLMYLHLILIDVTIMTSLYCVNHSHAQTLFNHRLSQAPLPFGTTYLMMHSLHIHFSHLNHVFHPFFCN